MNLPLPTAPAGKNPQPAGDAPREAAPDASKDPMTAGQANCRWQNWTECLADLTHLAERQLFFIGGAPRSGTTWLQQMLGCHPDISCRGEGFFWRHFAVPLERMMQERRKALESKNTNLFRHTGGYKLPLPDDTEYLLGTAILLALHRQADGAHPLAIGEKTPENVFLFPRLVRLFPSAKFIAIARDPRDTLASAWHFFHKPVADEDETAAKREFIRSALPSLAAGARAIIAFNERHPEAAMVVTYEGLHHAPGPILAHLFRFLGVSDRREVVENCLARTSFEAMTGGRVIGVEERGSFFRKGAVCDWSWTLTPEMNEIVLRELGWMFPRFGWQA